MIRSAVPTAKKKSTRARSKTDGTQPTHHTAASPVEGMIEMAKILRDGVIEVTQFHHEFPERVKSRARSALRRQIEECPEFRSRRIDAEVIIEQVWNALVGNDKIKPPQNEPLRGRTWRNKRRRK